MHESFGDLVFTSADAVHAAQLARGFGIKEKNIYFISDMPLPKVNKLIAWLKTEVKKISAKGGQTFIFCYAAGHGVADQ